MDIIAEVRRRHLVSGESISSIARSLKISRPTVRKHLSTEIEPVYKRDPQAQPWLEIDYQLPKNQRRTAQRLFEGLVGEGYTGVLISVEYLPRISVSHYQMKYLSG